MNGRIQESEGRSKGNMEIEEGNTREPANGESPQGAVAEQPVEHRTFAVTGMACGGSVTHVQRALAGIPGVGSARATLATGTVDVAYDAGTVAFPALQNAVRAAGYDLRELTASDTGKEAARVSVRRVPGWLVAAGVGAAALLAGFYMGIVTLAQGFDHALGLLAGDWYLVIPIVAGFGTQVGLFVHLRRNLRLRQGAGATKALAGAGTGTSTVSMVACCAHHLTDVLPVIGLSGAALFLNEYRGPLMGLGIVTNAIGIWVMLRVIRKADRCSPALSKPPSESGAGSTSA